jgi:cobalt/nickel transport protein
MKKTIIFSAILLTTFIVRGSASAHFGMAIPSDAMIMQGEPQNVTLTFSFSHPFDRVGMTLAKPKVIGVMANGNKLNLLDKAKKALVMGHTAWKVQFQVNRPGVYMFYMEPQPYWEPAEDCYIIHYTKTVVTAFGDDEGWDQEIGLKTEIVPLAKPFALYTGNVFQGTVKVDGEPVPFAPVEVEYYNENGMSMAPTDYMVTQTVKADKNGVFTYAAPKSGWWGFAALSPSKDKILRDGKEKEVELGAVIWVQFLDWQSK